MTTKTIKLTGRRPVLIVDEDWPQVVHVRGDSYEGSDPSRHAQAVAVGEVDEYRIVVRQHEDERALVYAWTDAATAWTGTKDSYAGILLDAGEDVAEAILRVARDCGIHDRLAHEAIAGLPPEEI